MCGLHSITTKMTISLSKKTPSAVAECSEPAADISVTAVTDAGRVVFILTEDIRNSVKF